MTVTGAPGAAWLVLSDGVNPTGNPMNHTINTVAPPRTDTIGVEIDRFDISAALTPGDTAIAGQNLLRVLAIRQGSYAEAVKAYNVHPEADRGAAEPSADVKAVREKLNGEADTLVDAAASFVVIGRTKNLPAANVDRVNQLLETVYKSRFPEDATLDGLKKVLAAKGLPSA